ncbi:MAG TPA: SGNH/GDSL hydrolase family protein [Burkholderiales bacterium]|nr:SGNH/GDSL hydrolase family protein [Burkholderiales bacterium]
MAERMTFAEFRRRLERRRLSDEQVADYVEKDPLSVPVRVRFRPGTLVDEPPPGYDLDDALNRYRNDINRTAARRAAKAEKPRVVAEGDSWFRLPFPWWKAIATRIAADGRFAVRNVARWGDTLESILSRKEYLTAIEEFRPSWCILSAGGNDLQIMLADAKFLHDYDPQRPLDQSLTPDGEALMQRITAGYRQLLGEIAQLDPRVRILCYGYDYPRPEVADGQFIGRFIAGQGYPRDRWPALVQVMLNRLNQAIEAAMPAAANAVFMSCLHATDDYTWYDDMHPADDGFKALAKKFEAKMRTARKRRAKRKRTR